MKRLQLQTCTESLWWLKSSALPARWIQQLILGLFWYHLLPAFPSPSPAQGGNAKGVAAGCWAASSMFETTALHVFALSFYCFLFVCFKKGKKRSKLLPSEGVWNVEQKVALGCWFTAVLAAHFMSCTGTKCWSCSWNSWTWSSHSRKSSTWNISSLLSKVTK